MGQDVYWDITCNRSRVGGDSSTGRRDRRDLQHSTFDKKWEWRVFEADLLRDQRGFAAVDGSERVLGG